MSSGLYTHITRAPGTIVTAPLYNTDHQAHLQNDIPSSTGGLSDNVAAMQATIDPAPGGVATPVVDLGSEFQQLRFVLKDIKTVYNGGTPPAQWYVPITAPTQAFVTAHGARVTRVPAGALAVANKVQVPVIFDTIEYDTGIVRYSFDPFFTLSFPTRMTAQQNGLYHFTGSLDWLAVSGSGLVLVLLLKKNSTQILASSEITLDSISTVRTLSVAAEVVLTAGDYVELVAFQTAAVSLSAINCIFAAELLNLSAAFAPPTLFLLSITESGAAGTVTANFSDDSAPSKINCPGTCSEQFVSGTKLFLHATPSGGHVFTAWSGDVPIGHTTDNPLFITMDQARTINAQFT